MNRKTRIVRIVCPVFFILALLFPIVNKSLHELEHLEEQHCTDASPLHFHKTEHECSLCDFHISQTTESFAPVIVSKIYSADFFYANPVITVPDFVKLSILSARAPPAFL